MSRYCLGNIWEVSHLIWHTMYDGVSQEVDVNQYYPVERFSLHQDAPYHEGHQVCTNTFPDIAYRRPKILPEVHYVHRDDFD